MEKPKSFKSGSGTVESKSKFYKGEALTINTAFGEVVIFCSSKCKAAAIGHLITKSNPIIIDEDKIQEVCVFSSSKISVASGDV